MWQTVLATMLVIFATLLCVLLFMLFGADATGCNAAGICVFLLISSGWYVVWQLFLSKFKFLRELVGDAGTPQAEMNLSETTNERLSSAPPHNRTKTARQRFIQPEISAQTSKPIICRPATVKNVILSQCQNKNK